MTNFKSRRVSNDRAPGFENWTYDLGFVDGAIRVTHKNIDTKMGEDGLAQ